MTARYRNIKINGRSRLEHRHVMEQHLGRALRTEEHVHHRNGNTRDNRLENLELIDGRKHITDHAEERRIYPRTKECVICGTTFTPRPTKRKRKMTCSTPCANEMRSRSEKATKAAAIVRAQFARVEAVDAA